MGKNKQLTFTVDKNALYHEEAFTDLKSATVRRLTPVKIDGTVDKTRRTVFIGHADLVTPQGPVPIEAELSADTLEKAFDALPSAMGKAAEEIRVSYNQMLEQQQDEQQHARSSKVIKGH
jgi:hypothetical protein